MSVVAECSRLQPKLVPTATSHYPLGLKAVSGVGARQTHKWVIYRRALKSQALPFFMSHQLIIRTPTPSEYP